MKVKGEGQKVFCGVAIGYSALFLREMYEKQTQRLLCVLP